MKNQHQPKTRAKRKSGSRKQKSSPPRTKEQYFGKPRRFQDLWDRVVSVVSKMRAEKTSLQQASRNIGISPRTVTKWGGSALQKNAGGRYTAKRNDQLLRVLMFPSPDGTREVAVCGSRQATKIAEYWNSLHRYLQTGDRSGLEKFRGKFVIDADRARLSFITDPTELKRLGSAGVLSFQSIYGRTL